MTKVERAARFACAVAIQASDSAPVNTRASSIRPRNAFGPPVPTHNRVVGVINVQHRLAHMHTGIELELLNTVAEQVGCLLVLSRLAAATVEEANHVELVLSSLA